MKALKLLVAMFLVSLLISNANAQTYSEVFENTWTGASKSRSEITESGYFYCTEKLSISYFDESDNTFTGVAKTIFSLDGTQYISEVNVSGSFYSSDNTMTVRPGTVIRQDALPGGLYWINTTLHLTVYLSEDHSGYYILSGKSSNQEYSDEYYEVTDYPY